MPACSTALLLKFPPLIGSGAMDLNLISATFYVPGPAPQLRQRQRSQNGQHVMWKACFVALAVLLSWCQAM